MSTTTQPDQTPVSRATLSLPWKGWTRTNTPEAIVLACDTAPLLVMLVPCRDGSWFGSYKIHGADPVVLPMSSIRLDRLEGMVVSAMQKALGEERDLLTLMQNAIEAMAIDIRLATMAGVYGD